MIERWMLSAILLGVVVAVGGLCGAHLCPRVGIPRRWFWLALMTFSVVVPIGMGLRPAPVAAKGDGGIALSQPELLATPPTQSPRNTDALLLIGWATLSASLAIFFAAVHRRTITQLRSWNTRELLGHTVTVSPDFGPAAVGLVRSRVVVPEWVLELPSEEQRLVLRHEQEHIDARDHFVLFAGVAAIVLMPWNVGLWWQLRRLRVGLELDCDARVAPVAADRPRYGQLLLQARTRQRNYHAALAFVPTPSVLAERLYALLESARLSPRQVARWSASAVACAVVVTRVPVPSVSALIRPAAPPHAERTAQMTMTYPRNEADSAKSTALRTPEIPRSAQRSPARKAVGAAPAISPNADAQRTVGAIAPATSSASNGFVAVGENMPADGLGRSRLLMDSNGVMLPPVAGRGGRAGGAGGGGGRAGAAPPLNAARGGFVAPGGSFVQIRQLGDTSVKRPDSSTVGGGRIGPLLPGGAGGGRGTAAMRVRPDSIQE